MWNELRSLQLAVGSPFYGPPASLGRFAVARTIDHFAHFALLPKEFRDANPSIPWGRLAWYRSRPFRSLSMGPDQPRTNAWLWRVASVALPQIAHQLSSPKMPRHWKNEGSGHLGIPEVLDPYRLRILRILRKRGVRRLRVYGSVARNQADERSDVDLLVDWKGPRGRNDRIQLGSDLSALIHHRVQVFTEAQTYWAVKERVLAEAIEYA